MIRGHYTGVLLTFKIFIYWWSFHRN